MRYIALGRVSTDAQGNNLSRDVQFETIHSYAKGQLWSCVGEFFDTASGAQKGVEEREGLRSALSLIEHKKADVLLMYDTSRIGREGRVVDDLIQKVYELGGKVGVATERRVFESSLEAEELLFWNKNVSHFEYLQIKKRTQKGKIRAIELGSFVFKPLTGYRIVKEDRINKLAIDERVALVIEEVFERFVNGEKKRDLATYCHSQGLEWDTRKITQLIKDVDIYAGGSRKYSIKLEGKEREIAYDFPGFITNHLAENVKKANKTVYRKDSKVTPYLGIVYCTCGAKAGIARRYSDKTQLICNTHFNAIYHKNKGREVPESHSHSVSDKFITEKIRSYLKEINQEELLERMDKTIEWHSTTYKEYQSRLKEIDEERQRILGQLTSLANLEYVAAALDSRLKELKQEEESTRDTLREFESITEALREARNEFEFFRPQAILQLLDKGTWKEINKALHSIGFKVTVDFTQPNARERIVVHSVY